MSDERVSLYKIVPTYTTGSTEPYTNPAGKDELEQLRSDLARVTEEKNSLKQLLEVAHSAEDAKADYCKELIAGRNALLKELEESARLHGMGSEREAKLLAESNQLRREIETERMRLAACGVAAMQNTEKSRTERIGRDNPYWSASYGDVCAAVDREMDLRSKLAGAEKALEWYADNDHWYKHSKILERGFSLIENSDLSPVTSLKRPVGGKRAREALSSLRAGESTEGEKV